jgi:hypothetical protein
LVRSQADLLFGIDLPDIVGLAGSRFGFGCGTAAFRRRPESRLLKPALQSARDWQRLLIVRTLQEETDQSSSPTRMFSTQA